MAFVRAMTTKSAFITDPLRTAVIARVTKDLEYRPLPYRPLADVTGPDRDHHVANFILFMVAIDHDTQRDGIKYEGVIGNRLLHGSDLLYALAERAKRADLSLFLPSSFTRVSDDRVAAIFKNDAGVLPHDVPGRARIFRECADRLLWSYDGDAANLIASAGGLAGGPDGLFARLATMPAFADPASKKANLLRKLLKRAELFRPTDPEHWDIASDHVVMTMALRSGVVRCVDPVTAECLRAGTELDAEQIRHLREVSKRALKDLAWTAGADVDDLDDLFWSYGRKSLREATPLTSPESITSDLDPLVDPAVKPAFLAALNGLDPGAAAGAKMIHVVRGPFTRNY